MISSARPLFPALTVGNSVVVKLTGDTPVTGGLLLARILEEAGLPSGVLSEQTTQILEAHTAIMKGLKG